MTGRTKRCDEAITAGRLHAIGEDHHEALALLGKVHPGGTELTKALGTLLPMKTRAGYSAIMVSIKDLKRAQRQTERLVNAARERRTA